MAPDHYYLIRCPWCPHVFSGRIVEYFSSVCVMRRGGGLCEVKSYQPQIALRYSHLCHKSYLESTNYIFTRQRPSEATLALRQVSGQWLGAEPALTNQIMSTHFYPGFVSWLVKLAPGALISWHRHPSHHHLHQQHLSIKIEVKLQGREHN